MYLTFSLIDDTDEVKLNKCKFLLNYGTAIKDEWVLV